MVSESLPCEKHLRLYMLSSLYTYLLATCIVVMEIQPLGRLLPCSLGAKVTLKYGY